MGVWEGVGKLNKHRISGGGACVNTTLVEQASQAHLSASKNLFMPVYSPERCTARVPMPALPPPYSLPFCLCLSLVGQAWSYRMYNMPTRDI